MPAVKIVREALVGDEIRSVGYENDEDVESAIALALMLGSAPLADGWLTAKPASSPIASPLRSA